MLSRQGTNGQRGHPVEKQTHWGHAVLRQIHWRDQSLKTFHWQSAPTDVNR